MSAGTPRTRIRSVGHYDNYVLLSLEIKVVHAGNTCFKPLHKMNIRQVGGVV